MHKLKGVTEKSNNTPKNSHKIKTKIIKQSQITNQRKTK